MTQLHTTVAFYELPSGTSEQFIAGVADQSHRVVSDDIFIGKFNRIVAAMAMGHALTYGKLESPSLRRFFNPFIYPKVSIAGDSYDTWKPQDLSRNPLILDRNEALNAKGNITEASATQGNVVGVNLAEGPLEPVRGEIHTMRMSAAATLTIGVWTNHTLTFPSDLPVGRYQIVGAQAYANYGGMFRFVPIGSDHRPGGMLAMDSQGGVDMTAQRMGNWGVWCEFDQLTQPTIEFCPMQAGTWYTLAIDLIKIG